MLLGLEFKVSYKNKKPVSFVKERDRQEKYVDQ